MTDRKARLVKLASGAAASIIIITAVLQASPGQAAEKEMKGRFVNQKSEVTFVKVGDKEGHVVGTFHNTGVDFTNGEVATRFSSGTFDYLKWTGPIRGHEVTVFKDGSTYLKQCEGEAKVDEKKVRTIGGAFTCISGTGRFEGIKCEGTWNCSIMNNRSCVGEYAGTMTLPE